MLRDLTRETPFWAAFGAWFSFYPVLARDTRKGPDSSWERFGSNGESFVFIARRRPESVSWNADESDSKLLSVTSDTFESLLQMMLE